jgi:hypothetical protein
MDSSPHEYIQELLKPLQEYQASGEYFRQYQSMMDFDRCLQALESRYAELYEQVMALEKKLSVYN